MNDNESGFYYLQSRYYDPKISRFINADSLASTGQGPLGYNMFAYCNNSPVLYVDSAGNACYPAMVKTTRADDDGGSTCDSDSEEDIGITMTKGKYLSVNLWVFNITLLVDMAFDSQGNVQPLLSITKDFNATGKLSASKGDTQGIYFIPDTSYLYKDTCKTYNVGGGVGIPVPGLPISVGGSVNFVMNTDAEIGVVFAQGTSTISASGGEWHVGIIQTYPLLPQINIYDAIELLSRWGNSK